MMISYWVEGGGVGYKKFIWGKGYTIVTIGHYK